MKYLFFASSPSALMFNWRVSPESMVSIWWLPSFDLQIIAKDLIWLGLVTEIVIVLADCLLTIGACNSYCALTLGGKAGYL